IKRDSLSTGAPLLPVTGARMIDENLTHHAGAHGEELGTVLPLSVPPIRQAKIKLVDQRSRLKCMAGILARDLPVCETFQLCKPFRKCSEQMGKSFFGPVRSRVTPDRKKRVQPCRVPESPRSPAPNSRRTPDPLHHRLPYLPSLKLPTGNSGQCSARSDS